MNQAESNNEFFFLQIQYRLATTKQVEQVFKRFYPAERFARPQSLDDPSENNLTSGHLPGGRPTTLKLERYYTPEELDSLAVEFSNLMADETYSVAELQGYLLNKKWDPQGAVDDLPAWMKVQEEEKMRIEEAKQRKRLQAAQRRQAAKELYEGKKHQNKESVGVTGSGEVVVHPSDRLSSTIADNGAMHKLEGDDLKVAMEGEEDAA